MGDQDRGREEVAARGLTAAAVGALIPLMGSVGFEELGLVKALLKRFFSTAPWTAMDAAALADAVGAPSSPAGDDNDGVDVITHRLADDLELVAGWVDGRFVLDVEVGTSSDAADPSLTPSPAGAFDLGFTFDTDVVPEPTPNPRTIRFATGHRPVDASRAFRRGEAIDDGEVAAVFAVDDDVVDVLVAAGFVAVSIARPARWPELLAPVLAAVAAGFAGGRAPAPDDDLAVAGADVRGVSAPGGAPDAGGARPARRTRLDRAWAELGRLDARRPPDLQLLLEAVRDPDGARRQVAAQLLDAAPEDTAVAAWSVLLEDPSRTVRRAVVDAAAGAGHASGRPLLERATADSDAWIRWKALRGLVDLGIEASRPVVDALAHDPDFRVRLEAENAGRR